MGRGPVAKRCHVNLAGVGLGIGDEFRNRLSWNRWVNYHDIWQKGESRNGRDVLDEIEIEFLIERCIDNIRRSNQEKRIAIGGRTHDRLGGDIAARAGPVVDDEWLAEPLRQPLPYYAYDNIAPRTGWKSDDHAHRLRRIDLGNCDLREERMHHNAR